MVVQLLLEAHQPVEYWVERFDFSDPQGGKGEADRQAATIKGHISIYLNEGHDVNSPAQMKEAIESNGGIPGVSVKYVKIPELSINKPMIKWDGISTLNNFQFHPSGVQAWAQETFSMERHSE